jgi:hypothetical protein
MRYTNRKSCEFQQRENNERIGRRADEHVASRTMISERVVVEII